MTVLFFSVNLISLILSELTLFAMSVRPTAYSPCSLYFFPDFEVQHVSTFRLPCLNNYYIIMFKINGVGLLGLAEMFVGLLIFDSNLHFSTHKI